MPSGVPAAHGSEPLTRVGFRLSVEAIFPTLSPLVGAVAVGRPMVTGAPGDTVRVTPVAVAVALAEMLTVVALVTRAMVALAGMPAPVMVWPLSQALTKPAVAEVTTLEAFVVTPSETVSGRVSVAAEDSTAVVGLVTDAMYVLAGMPQPVTGSCTSEAWKPAEAEVTVVLPLLMLKSVIWRVVETSSSAPIVNVWAVPAVVAAALSTRWSRW